jgi:hypothetical protein
MSDDTSRGRVSALKKRADELRGLSGVSPDALAQARAAGREATEAGVSQATHVSPAELGTFSPGVPPPKQQVGQEDTSARARGKAIENQHVPAGTAATKALPASPEEKKVAQQGALELQQIAQKMREQNVTSQDVAAGRDGPTPTPPRDRGGPGR